MDDAGFFVLSLLFTGDLLFLQGNRHAGSSKDELFMGRMFYGSRNIDERAYRISPHPHFPDLLSHPQGYPKDLEPPSALRCPFICWARLGLVCASRLDSGASLPDRDTLPSSHRKIYERLVSPRTLLFLFHPILIRVFTLVLLFIWDI